MIFRDFFILSTANLFCKGDILNIFVFFITFFFLCKICIPDGIPILLMFIALRDNINKFLAEDLENNSFELFLLTEGNLTRLLYKKVMSFFFTHGSAIILLSCILHVMIYENSTHIFYVALLYIINFLVFFIILAICSVFTIAQKDSYILINLLYPPFILPTVLLANLFLNNKIGMQVIYIAGLPTIITSFFLLQLIIKNRISE